MWGGGEQQLTSERAQVRCSSARHDLLTTRIVRHRADFAIEA
jgi:hypothetical protein